MRRKASWGTGWGSRCRSEPRTLHKHDIWWGMEGMSTRDCLQKVT